MAIEMLDVLEEVLHERHSGEMSERLCAAGPISLHNVRLANGDPVVPPLGDYLDDDVLKWAREVGAEKLTMRRRSRP